MTKTYKRSELAHNQLETAIGLFISGRDKLSAITLAGAADVLLSRMVLNAGGENFTDYSLKRHREKLGESATRETYGKEINDVLHINALKHMDSGDDEWIDIDVEQSALGAILKALTNYAQLFGRDAPLVAHFLAWGKSNLDPSIYNVDCDPDWSPE